MPINEHEEADLVSLHNELVAELRRRIREGDASASDLSVARQLIKDNGIADLRPNAPVRDLAEDFPFNEIEQEVDEYHV